jgi:hypothetical protein
MCLPRSFLFAAVRADALQLTSEFLRVFTLEAVMRCQVDTGDVLDPKTLADNMQAMLEDFV